MALRFTERQDQQLTAGGAVNVEPRWSPDGKKIAWVSTQYNRRFHIFVADFDGELKNIVRLTGETKSPLPRYYYSAYDMEINPVWARDGKEILFVSNKGHIYGTGGFWRMKAEPRRGSPGGSLRRDQLESAPGFFARRLAHGLQLVSRQAVA